MRFESEPSPTTEGLLGVWCDDREAIAVGRAGTILRRSAVGWTSEASGTMDNLFAVHGSERSIVAVGGKLRIGGDTTLLHAERPLAASWSVEPSGMQHILLTVARGRDAWFAAGYNGAILRGEPGNAGRNWQRLELSHFLHVFALAALDDRVFAAGLSGMVIELDAAGALVRTHDTGTTSHLRAMSAAEGVIMAVGLGGAIVRYDGRRWSTLEGPEDAHLEGVWVEDARTAWAVGSDGVILRFDGTRATRAESGTRAFLHAVHGSREQVVAVGAAGAICRAAR